MTTSTVTILVNSFSLQFEVDVEESREFTSRFIPATATSDYKFIRADLFVIADGERIPMLSRAQLGNVMKLLSLIEQRLSAPASSALPEGLVEPGGLGAWLDSYFAQQFSDESTAPDDASYSAVNDKALAADNNGVLAVYSVGAAMIVEVWARDATSRIPRVWWHACDPVALSAKIGQAIEECRMAVDARPA